MLFLAVRGSSARWEIRSSDYLVENIPRGFVRQLEAAIIVYMAMQCHLYWY